jgi:hypothetical protein
MKYADDRAHGIALLRKWANLEAVRSTPREAQHGLLTALHALLHDLHIEHDLPGVRYWEHPESDSFFTTLPGERLDDTADGQGCIELARHEYLSRQRIFFEGDSL